MTPDSPQDTAASERSPLGGRQSGAAKRDSAPAQRLRQLLVETARRRGTVTYGEAARYVYGGRVSARSSVLMRLLSQVDSEEEARTGAWIATLVVRADTGRPGDGYFMFAAEAGRDISDREALWCHEAEKVWAAYGKGGAS